MPQRVHAGGFHDAGGTDGVLDRLRDGRFVNVMAANGVRTGVFRTVGGGKDVLPGPLPIGPRVFLRQRLGQFDLPEAFPEVLLVPFLYPREMLA